jgi:hypothetical protein
MFQVLMGHKVWSLLPPWQTATGPRIRDAASSCQQVPQLRLASVRKRSCQTASAELACWLVRAQLWKGISRAMHSHHPTA